MWVTFTKFCFSLFCLNANSSYICPMPSASSFILPVTSIAICLLHGEEQSKPLLAVVLLLFTPSLAFFYGLSHIGLYSPCWFSDCPWIRTSPPPECMNLFGLLVLGRSRYFLLILKVPGWHSLAILGSMPQIYCSYKSCLWYHRLFWHKNVMSSIYTRHHIESFTRTIV